MMFNNITLLFLLFVLQVILVAMKRYPKTHDVT